MDHSLQDRRNSTVDRLKPGPILTHPVTIHYEIQNHTTRMQKITKAFRVYRLMVLTLICVIAGVIIGLICRPRARYWSERQFMYIEFPGELYLRFLRLIIIPLLVSNVILSFGTIQGKISSQLGKVAGFIYMGNNFMAISVAILIAIIICPGGKLIHNNNNNDNYNNHHNISDNHELDGHRDKVPSANLPPNLANHHLFNEFHDSIARYREYHPMFYHSDKDENVAGNAKNEEQKVGSINEARKQSANQESLNLIDRHELKERATKPLNDLLLENQFNKNDDTETIKKKISIEVPVENVEQFEMMKKTQLRYGNNMNKYTSTNKDNNEDQNQRVEFIGLQILEGNLNDNHSQRNLYKNDAANNVHNLNTKLPIDVVLDVLRNLIPDSLIGSTLHQTRTRLFAPEHTRIDSNGSANPSPSLWPMGHELMNQPNIIGLLAASVLAGVVLSHMEEASKPLLDLCSCVSELSLRVGIKAINLAPPCIMFLLIGQVARARNLSSMASELLMYCITVIIALLLHGFVLLPTIYYLITKKSPLKFFKGLMEALVASFATSSSSATMPLVLNCLAELDLNLVIVRAFGPLGCVFNMNGTAIYEAVGVIFIAQTLSVPLPFTSILLIGFCSAIASLSTSGIPSSGMMNMVIVLNAINLPVLQLSLIYIVDFIIDRFRTVVNVWSGAIVCGLVDHICPEHLFEEEMKPEKYREMMKYRGSRGSLSNRKSLVVEEKPQVISVTITPPIENNSTTPV